MFSGGCNPCYLQPWPSIIFCMPLAKHMTGGRGSFSSLSRTEKFRFNITSRRSSQVLQQGQRGMACQVKSPKSRVCQPQENKTLGAGCWPPYCDGGQELLSAWLVGTPALKRFFSIYGKVVKLVNMPAQLCCSCLTAVCSFDSRQPFSHFGQTERLDQRLFDSIAPDVQT